MAVYVGHALSEINYLMASHRLSCLSFSWSTKAMMPNYDEINREYVPNDHIEVQDI